MQCSVDIVPKAYHAICAALQSMFGRHRELDVTDTTPILVSRHRVKSRAVWPVLGFWLNFDCLLSVSDVFIGHNMHMKADLIDTFLWICNYGRESHTRRLRLCL